MNKSLVSIAIVSLLGAVALYGGRADREVPFSPIKNNNNGRIKIVGENSFDTSKVSKKVLLKLGKGNRKAFKKINNLTSKYDAADILVELSNQFSIS